MEVRKSSVVSRAFFGSAESKVTLRLLTISDIPPDKTTPPMVAHLSWPGAEKYPPFTLERHLADFVGLYPRLVTNDSLIRARGLFRKLIATSTVCIFALTLWVSPEQSRSPQFPSDLPYF
ncbi:hypothetical protein T265_12245 [Opisthorchis viverrini]|uniref:Uncharacterized protein n=1 Tax=Opisthorchis viverrini TaxID=6198 RepID=A0A074YUR3_OPIVI|nr:hypothetical protein T265_12245 [Opisthorchis viverrini]KER18521.1 hypothetical protein T265_12245 [Opisthorchis viverrini]